MADRFVEINYSPKDGLTLRFMPRSLSLIPQPAREHLQAANKELLLALRSFVDQAIEGLEPDKDRARGPRKVRVKDAAEEPEEV